MTHKLLTTLCLLILLGIFAGSAPVIPVTAEPLACSESNCFYFPVIHKGAPPLYFPLVLHYDYIVEEALIIDHDNIDITKIPDEWLAAARALTIHYGQTSHGSQILDGLEYVKTYLGPSKYAYAISPGGTPPTLPAGADLLKLYTGNNYSGDTYIIPEMYWRGSTGISHTNSTAATGLF